MRVISGMTTIGAGDERIELRPARGQHAADMMLVYLPARRLLYGSDVLTPATFEPVFTAAYRSELLTIVARQNLVVDSIITVHLPPTPWSTIREKGS